ncbi:tRNA (guanosine(46)-N7)-methyltransferase TrmB [Tenuibacillus multivorans]|uniref:tRNA (guanine-N(7)-)-methyltransferase n=1 Tax=Tenuibacillus multivorans TaxID=237069 RepID=A0A1H0ED66_9BACI|nr:tRNA (guanosine(46)-N7)-methyltransferase TrmB [Tenuibacillus multivorans]GEL77207.1 tRNA (guanine-N(7)-)-methyltransferase [Tenuibacillus multivorans]SDN80270.1 tRNA (guanine-N7-)-methyltransferase [Tenuibacillus multivorans]
MRLRHKPWAADFIKEHDDIAVLNPFDYRGKWQELFEINQPIGLEIGTGKGQFIANMAQQNKHMNFIGIEKAESIIVTAIQKVLDAEVSNAHLIHENAKDLRDIIAENEIDIIYLNFSDPWPKTRHEKRRLTYHAFLDQYQSILKDDGRIVLKTDNRHFFEYSIVSFSQFGMTLEEVTLDLHKLEDDTNVMTEYEEKFSSKGQPIYRCIAKF